MKQVVSIEGASFAVTNLEKVLWPKDRITKGELIDFYVRLVPWILPHLKDRPLVLKRYPEGVGEDHFYEKRCPSYAPDWVRSWQDKTEKDQISYCLCQNVATLAWLANLADIELHVWLSTFQRPDEPTYAVFDLDPDPPSDFRDACDVALMVKEALDRLSLYAVPKTSGAGGLQIYLPLNTPHSFKEVRLFLLSLYRVIEKLLPKTVSLTHAVSERKGRVYLDYLQNVRGKSMVAVYSLRALPGAPISAPLKWQEVKSGVSPADFNFSTIFSRLESEGDLFKDVLTVKQSVKGLRFK
jgi:bifunctional non-homologous end joining protein LigD